MYYFAMRERAPSSQLQFRETQIRVSSFWSCHPKAVARNVSYCNGPAWVTGPGGHRALHWFHLNHTGEPHVRGKSSFLKEGGGGNQMKREGLLADEINTCALQAFNLQSRSNKTDFSRYFGEDSRCFENYQICIFSADTLLKFFFFLFKRPISKSFLQHQDSLHYLPFSLPLETSLFPLPSRTPYSDLIEPS